MTPERKRRLEKLRRKLVKIAGSEDRLEGLAVKVTRPSEEEEGEEGLESMPAPAVKMPDPRDEKALQKIRNGDFDALSDDESFGLEAIVLRDGRPVSFIKEGTFQFQEPLWRDFNAGVLHEKIKKIIPAIGRVEKFSPGGVWVDHVGTGFIVGEGLMMTNRHVAEFFVTGAGAEELIYTPGGGLHFGREQGSDLFKPEGTLRVTGVKMVHPYWDMALLQVTGLPPGLVPLTLSVEDPGQLIERRIATLGYPGPGKDLSPEAQELEMKCYGGIYGVKRIAPGEIDGRRSVSSFGHLVDALTHDSSTLAGNSGSGVFDVENETVVGLHFKGKTLDANYAVPAHELARDSRVVDVGVNFAGKVDQGNHWEDFWKSGAVEGAGGRKVVVPGVTFKQNGAPARQPDAPVARPVPVPAQRLEVGGADGAGLTITVPLTISVSLGGGAGGVVSTNPVETEGLEAVTDYSDREGYDKDFLGVELRVPLPKVVRDADKVLRFGEDEETELRYHHFSVVMHEPRRMCIYSAVNIDGKLSKSKKRTGWRLDSRIPNEAQILKECYGDQPKFSRGHMTRREDPVWGTDKMASGGNADSMHVTNAVPQMQPFNAPIWLGLEDYALENAREDDQRISVFTGPVFRKDDPTYYGVKVPVSFWKIIAFIHDVTGKLCATGYTMSQKAQLPQEGLEFVFGQHEQSQTSLKHIEKLTGLKFGAKLIAADPFDAEDDGTESSVAAVRALSDPAQIRWV